MVYFNELFPRPKRVATLFFASVCIGALDSRIDTIGWQLVLEFLHLGVCLQSSALLGYLFPSFGPHSRWNQSMELVQLDEHGRLYLSPAIDDWEPIHNSGISAVIDLDGDVDHGIPTVPNQMLYIYFPIYDDDLPDLRKLHAVAKLGASLVESGRGVLTHCGLGLNRSALVAGLILTYLGLRGDEAVRLLREKRPGSLFNDKFAAYLQSLSKQQVTDFARDLPAR